ncbi:MAG: RlmE family RNA methyltransferase [Euryarchaeota archaeon]|jgi:23S rRNA (uridine2552-2'-O)-methyltransferase|nr:RlmE family RNA methyltransferase [Euryarchaeota archaeon]
MTRWYTEKKKEHFYKEAKRVGYRARSAFKLQQIQNRFHLIPKDGLVVDLGAAPGGWSQVAKELVGTQGIVIGADISSIKPFEDVQFIQGDVTKTETLEQIKNLMGGRNADVVLSDMSPDISGNYSVDQARSAWLCQSALHVATQLLQPGGHFICKIFEGEDTKAFIEKVKHQFMVVKTFSPEASRKSSSEVYIIAKSFKNPYKKDHK